MVFPFYHGMGMPSCSFQRDARIDGDLTYGQALENHLEVIGKLFILAMMAER